MTALNPKATEMLVVGAFRYYLGRKTYAVSEFVEWLGENWQTFNGNTQEIIRRETRQALEMGEAGMAMDRNLWERVRAFDDACPKCGMIHYNCLCSHTN